MITRVPPGTWETLSFPSSKAAGDTAYQLQIDPRLRVRGRGDEQRTQRWYRQAKETKRGEMGGRESQRLIVPSSQGNHPEGTLGREGDASYEPLEGNMIGTPRPATVLTKQQRIAELARNGPEMAFTTLRITSTSIGCTWRMPRPARTELLAWTDKRRPTTRTT